MSKLRELCKKEKVSIIAVEPQYSPREAEALQANLKNDGIKVAIVTLDPLETADIPKDSKFNPAPDFYLTKMRENIEAIVKALP